MTMGVPAGNPMVMEVTNNYTERGPSQKASKSINHTSQERVMEHNHHDHENHTSPTTGEKVKLATSATVHCLLGCGLGEIVGIIIGKALALSTVHTIILAVSLGFVFGFALVASFTFSPVVGDL